MSIASARIIRLGELHALAIPERSRDVTRGVENAAGDLQAARHEIVT